VIRIRGKFNVGETKQDGYFGQLGCPYGGTNRRTMSIDTKEVFVPIAEAPQAPLRRLALATPQSTPMRIRSAESGCPHLRRALHGRSDRTDFSSCECRGFTGAASWMQFSGVAVIFGLGGCLLDCGHHHTATPLALSSLA